MTAAFSLKHWSKTAEYAILFPLHSWRSWIARQTPTLKAVGSNPAGCAIPEAIQTKGLYGFFVYPKNVGWRCLTAILTAILIFFLAHQVKK